MAIIAGVNSTMLGILQGIAKLALQQSPPDIDTLQDIQNFADNFASWPAYTVTATTSTTGPIVLFNQIAGAATGTCGVYPAVNVIDGITQVVTQAGGPGVLNPKFLGA